MINSCFCLTQQEHLIKKRVNNTISLLQIDNTQIYDDMVPNFFFLMILFTVYTIVEAPVTPEINIFTTNSPESYLAAKKRERCKFNNRNSKEEGCGPSNDSSTFESGSEQDDPQLLSGEVANKELIASGRFGVGRIDINLSNGISTAGNIESDTSGGGLERTKQRSDGREQIVDEETTAGIDTYIHTYVHIFQLN